MVPAGPRLATSELQRVGKLSGVQRPWRHRVREGGICAIFGCCAVDGRRPPLAEGDYQRSCRFGPLLNSCSAPIRTSTGRRYENSLARFFGGDIFESLWRGLCARPLSLTVAAAVCAACTALPRPAVATVALTKDCGFAGIHCASFQTGCLHIMGKVSWSRDDGREWPGRRLRRQKYLRLHSALPRQ
jgi:hypothetical protein